MGLPFLLPQLVLLVLTTFLIKANTNHRQQIIQLIHPTEGAPCQGHITECSPEVEFVMDSDTNRRILATAAPAKYISYRALLPGTTPCSLRGKSYYNCKPSKTNPYHRSCSVITRCRS